MDFITNRTQLISDCKEKLLQTRSEIINRVQRSRSAFLTLEKSGDEADQSVAVLAENEYFATNTLLQERLYEIDCALERIGTGTFGICEETEEPIEPARLRAVPWTTLSIEGAEIREEMTKRYAR